jgi:hypothetical protein
VFLHAQQAHAPYASMESLVEALTRVRRVTVARSASGTGRMRVTTQLEDVDPSLAPFLASLGVTKELVYTPRA